MIDRGPRRRARRAGRRRPERRAGSRPARHQRAAPGRRHLRCLVRSAERTSGCQRHGAGWAHPLADRSAAGHPPARAGDRGPVRARPCWYRLRRRARPVHRPAARRHRHRHDRGDREVDPGVRGAAVGPAPDPAAGRARSWVPACSAWCRWPRSPYLPGPCCWPAHRSDAPSSAAPDVALAIVWFVLGLGVYAFLFAALGALVYKVTEVSSALMPVYFLLIGSYMLSVLVVLSAPTSCASVAGSPFPLTSPIVMPMRWGVGCRVGLGTRAEHDPRGRRGRAAGSLRGPGLPPRRRTGQRVRLRQVLRPQHAATASR